MSAVSEICDRLDRAIYRLHRVERIVLNTADRKALWLAHDSRTTTFSNERPTHYRGSPVLWILDGTSFVEGADRRGERQIEEL